MAVVFKLSLPLHPSEGVNTRRRLAAESTFFVLTLVVKQVSTSSEEEGQGKTPLRPVQPPWLISLEHEDVASSFCNDGGKVTLR
jgi:hypothetical protein